MTAKKLTKWLALYLPYILLGLVATNFGEASKGIPFLMVCTLTMSGMMMTPGVSPARLLPLSWSTTGEQLSLQSR